MDIGKEGIPKCGTEYCSLKDAVVDIEDVRQYAFDRNAADSWLKVRIREIQIAIRDASGY